MKDKKWGQQRPSYNENVQVHYLLLLVINKYFFFLLLIKKNL